MATKLIARVTGTGGTAVQVAAANAGRQSLLMRVNNSTNTSFGSTNAVTASNGFSWFKDDGIYQDSVPATDALWANAPVGAPIDVSVWEITS